MLRLVILLDGEHLADPWARWLCARLADVVTTVEIRVAVPEADARPSPGPFERAFEQLERHRAKVPAWPEAPLLAPSGNMGTDADVVLDLTDAGVADGAELSHHHPRRGSVVAPCRR